MATFLVRATEVVTTTYRIEGETVTEALRNFHDGDKEVVDDDIHDTELLGVYRVELDGREIEVTEEWEQAEELDDSE